MRTPKMPDLASYPKKCRTVIKALESLGLEPGWELVHGEGYFYFVGPESAMLPRSGVYIYHLGDFTLGQWIEEFKSLTGRGDDLKAPPPEPKSNGSVITTSQGKTIIRIQEDWAMNATAKHERHRETGPGKALRGRTGARTRQGRGCGHRGPLRAPVAPGTDL